MKVVDKRENNLLPFENLRPGDTFHLINNRGEEENIVFIKTVDACAINAMDIETGELHWVAFDFKVRKLNAVTIIN